MQAMNWSKVYNQMYWIEQSYSLISTPYFYSNPIHLLPLMSALTVATDVATSTLLSVQDYLISDIVIPTNKLTLCIKVGGHSKSSTAHAHCWRINKLWHPTWLGLLRFNPYCRYFVGYSGHYLLKPYHDLPWKKSEPVLSFPKCF